MSATRVAVVGAGFWARFQTAAWGEVAGAEVVAAADLSLDRARALHPAAYDDPERMIRETRPDLVDVVSPPEAHREHIELCARLGVDCVSQKPLAPEYADAEAAVAACERAGTRLWVHENFRFQAPLARLAGIVASGEIGSAFRARLRFAWGFDVFANQPGLKLAERFVLADVGVHLADVARALFGEGEVRWASAARTRPDVRGETVATVVLAMERCPVVTLELGYAAAQVEEAFPETLALVEGDRGTVELGVGGRLRTATRAGVREEVAASPAYLWADPAYAVVHASVAACHRAILADRDGGPDSGVRGRENLRSLALVEEAYRQTGSGAGSNGLPTMRR